MKRIIAILAILCVSAVCYLFYLPRDTPKQNKQENPLPLLPNANPIDKQYHPEVKPLPLPKDPPKLKPLIPEDDKTKKTGDTK